MATELTYQIHTYHTKSGFLCGSAEPKDLPPMKTATTVDRGQWTRVDDAWYRLPDDAMDAEAESWVRGEYYEPRSCYNRT